MSTLPKSATAAHREKPLFGGTTGAEVPCFISLMQDTPSAEHEHERGSDEPRGHGCNAVAEAPDAARVGQPSPVQWTVQWVVGTEHHEP